MVRRLRLIIAIFSGSLAALAIAAGWFYWASHRVPPFYAAALAEPTETAHEASDALLRGVAALFNDLRHAGHWQAQFSIDQINGWLADDMLRNHPTLFPSEISEPRLGVENDRLMLGFRWHGKRWTLVVSLEAELYLREINVVAVRIHKLRAGSLPLPLEDLVDDLVAAGRRLDLQIDKRQLDGDPLLLIAPPQDGEYNDSLVQLEALQLRDGQLYLAGRTEKGARPAGPLARRTDGETSPPATQAE